MYKNILYSVKNSIATITVNRPDMLNALTAETIREIGQAMKLAIESSNTFGVILTGQGKKAFVAGADIKEISSLDMHEGRKLSREGQAIFSAIEMSPKPVIALINGFALGGGLELAMSCHFRLASENAKFGQPEVKLGLVPGYGGTQRLPRLVGKGRAMELLLTGDMIDAPRAYQIGLVNKVYPAEQLIEEGIKMMRRITTRGPLAVQYCIEAVHHGLNSSLETGLEIEANYFGMAFATKDMQEGTTAFIEKRKANFKGE